MGPLNQEKQKKIFSWSPGRVLAAGGERTTSEFTELASSSVT